MAITVTTRPVILIAAAKTHPLGAQLESDHYGVVPAYTGAAALKCACELQPDVIILDAELPDMTGADACRAMHNELRIGNRVPILILAPDQPTPEQRVAAVRAGAWDFLRYTADAVEVTLHVRSYVHAKRNIDAAFADGLGDPMTGLYGRPAVARRAREVGALMSRGHGALACIVFVLETAPVDFRAGRVLARTARACDIVGELSPTEVAVVAPATYDVGAVRLAERIAGPLREEMAALPGSWAPVTAGYDAVANLSYSPIDPIELLGRAASAARHGKPDQHHAWIRRFEGRT